MMKEEMKEGKNRIGLEEGYEEKLEELMEELKREVEQKDQEMEEYQNYLWSKMEVGDERKLWNMLVRLLKECLVMYVE